IHFKSDGAGAGGLPAHGLVKLRDGAFFDGFRGQRRGVDRAVGHDDEHPSQPLGHFFPGRDSAYSMASVSSAHFGLQGLERPFYAPDQLSLELGAVLDLETDFTVPD